MKLKIEEIKKIAFAVRETIEECSLNWKLVGTCFSTALGAAVCVGSKMDKKASCLNVAKRSEFRRFPIFCPTQTGTPQGQRIAVAFFGLPFLAKQER
jgi:hypothetical protein